MSVQFLEKSMYPSLRKCVDKSMSTDAGQADGQSETNIPPPPFKLRLRVCGDKLITPEKTVNYNITVISIM